MMFNLNLNAFQFFSLSLLMLFPRIAENYMSLKYDIFVIKRCVFICTPHSFQLPKNSRYFSVTQWYLTIKILIILAFLAFAEIFSSMQNVFFYFLKLPILFLMLPLPPLNQPTYLHLVTCKFHDFMLSITSFGFCNDFAENM